MLHGPVHLHSGNESEFSPPGVEGCWLWAELCNPPNPYVEVLTSSPQNDCTWSWAFKEVK